MVDEGARTTRAYVGLGSNVGDAAGHLRDGIRRLRTTAGIAVVSVSRLYVTAPVGVTDQTEFRNAAAALDVPAGPDPASGAIDLLVTLKDLERSLGRRRRQRWGPREIDLDILAFGADAIAVERPPEGRSIDVTKHTPLLVVPHASSRERLFVLAPWADIAPSFRPPGWTEPVAAARDLQRAIEGDDAVRPVATWDEAALDWRSLAEDLPEG